MLGRVHEILQSQSGLYGSGESTSMGLLRDGTPFISTQTWQGRSLQNTQKLLDGRDVGELQYGDKLQPLRLEPRNSFSRIGINRRYWVYEPFMPVPPLTEFTIHDAGQKWELRESEQKSGVYYWVEVNLFTSEVIGYLDKNGIRDDQPDAGTCFETPQGLVHASGLIIFRSQDEVLVIDLKEKSVARVGSQDELLEWGIRMKHPNIEHRREVILLTEDAIKTADPAGNELQAFPIGGKSRKLYLTDDQRLLVKISTDREKNVEEGTTTINAWETLYELKDDGSFPEIAKTNVISVRTQLTDTRAAWILHVDAFFDQTAMGFLFPAPAPLFIFQSGAAYIITYVNPSKATYLQNITEMQEVYPWSFPVTILFGVISRLFCYRRQRRYQASWTKTWVVFVFLFGPAGYFAWRWHRVWPPLEMVGVTPETFEGPAANGLEVFA